MKYVEPMGGDVFMFVTRMPRHLKYRVKLHCTAEGRTMARFIAEALETHLKRPQPRRKKR